MLTNLAYKNIAVFKPCFCAFCHIPARSICRQNHPGRRPRPAPAPPPAARRPALEIITARHSLPPAIADTETRPAPARRPEGESREGRREKRKRPAQQERRNASTGPPAGHRHRHQGKANPPTCQHQRAAAIPSGHPERPAIRRERREGRGRGGGASRRNAAASRQSHKRPNPATYTTSAHQHWPAVAILPALDRLHPSPVQFCFWRENRTPATSTPDYRREKEPRPPAQHTGTGGASTFSPPRSILQIDSVPFIPHVPLIFTRQQPRASPFYRRENIIFPKQQNTKNFTRDYHNRLNFSRLLTEFYPKETKIHRFIVDFRKPLWYNKLRKAIIVNMSFNYLDEVIL